MGCCSSTNSSYSPPNHHRMSDVGSDNPFQSNSPPLPPEQESVKEVLSETPVPKPQFPIRIEETGNNYNRVNWPELSEKVIHPHHHRHHSPVAHEQVEEMSVEEGEVRPRSPAKFRNRSVSCQRRSIQTSPGRVDRQRRDSGEISGRRSSSPATRSSRGINPGLSRNPSSSRKRTGKSPGRARSEPDKYCGKDEDKLKWAPTVNESLENPVVSLECFIFM